MFSIMHFLLFGVLKIGKNPDHDVIRIFFALAQASFRFHFWRVLRGLGLLRAPRGAPRRMLIVNR